MTTGDLALSFEFGASWAVAKIEAQVNAIAETTNRPEMILFSKIPTIVQKLKPTTQ